MLWMDVQSEGSFNSSIGVYQLMSLPYNELIFMNDDDDDLEDIVSVSEHGCSMSFRLNRAILSQGG